MANQGNDREFMVVNALRNDLVRTRIAPILSQYGNVRVFKSPVVAYTKLGDPEYGGAKVDALFATPATTPEDRECLDRLRMKAASFNSKILFANLLVQELKQPAGFALRIAGNDQAEDLPVTVWMRENFPLQPRLQIIDTPVPSEFRGQQAVA